MLLPISAIIPTRDRQEVLQRTVVSLSRQSALPCEVIIVDASNDETFAPLNTEDFSDLKSDIRHFRTKQVGAAIQREIGLKHATQEFILFLDDDILFEPDCIIRLWQCITKDEQTGGVNAMIMNQHYTRPGKISRFMYWLMSGERRDSYAGMVIGPAWNLLPEPGDHLPECVPCQWLNTTCTLYRRVALPSPLFDEIFQGYSLMEDVALSVKVSRKWKLYNARKAKIYHDSQPGTHKDDLFLVHHMELFNRYFIMTKVLRRTAPKDYCRLIIYELWSIFNSFRNLDNLRQMHRIICGKISAIKQIRLYETN
ncbi:MAG: glycosyltransferase [Methanobacteriota archaeon]|nr:MAG: glycosyltransferase [Euryarchaeota archaeon]